jgi:hypothetical protein
MLSNDYSSTTIDADGNRRFTWWQVDLEYPRCIVKGYIRIVIKDSSGSNMGSDSTLGENRTTFYTDWAPSILGYWVGSFTSAGVGTYNATGTISNTKYSYDKFMFSWQTEVGTSTLVGDIFMESCLSMDSKLRVPVFGTGTAYAPPGYVWRNGQSSMQVDLEGYLKHPDFSLLWGTWDAEDYQHGPFSISKQ